MLKNKNIYLCAGVVIGLIAVSYMLPKELLLGNDFYRIKALYIEAGALAIVFAINLARSHRNPIETNIKLAIGALVLAAILDVLIANRALFDLIFSVLYFSLIYLVYLIRKIS